MAKDLVCGMEVDEKKAPAKSEYNGKTYYFCSMSCKKTFEKNPSKHLVSGSQQVGGHGSHHM